MTKIRPDGVRSLLSAGYRPTEISRLLRIPIAVVLAATNDGDRTALPRARAPIECPNCGTTFTPSPNRSRYCCRRCSDEARRVIWEDDVEELISGGCSPQEIAARLGVGVQSLERVAYRHGRPDLARRVHVMSPDPRRHGRTARPE